MPLTTTEAKKIIDFGRDIRPILEAKCLECHGPKQAKDDYRVDTRASLLTYIEPGDLAGSSLWTDYLITEDEEMRMPPASHEKPLAGVELAAQELARRINHVSLATRMPSEFGTRLPIRIRHSN